MVTATRLYEFSGALYLILLKTQSGMIVLMYLRNLGTVVPLKEGLYLYIVSRDVNPSGSETQCFCDRP